MVACSHAAMPNSVFGLSGSDLYISPGAAGGDSSVEGVCRAGLAGAHAKSSLAPFCGSEEGSTRRSWVPRGRMMWQSTRPDRATGTCAGRCGGGGGFYGRLSDKDMQRLPPVLFAAVSTVGAHIITCTRGICLATTATGAGCTRYQTRRNTDRHRHLLPLPALARIMCTSSAASHLQYHTWVGHSTESCLSRQAPPLCGQARRLPWAPSLLASSPHSPAMQKPRMLQ